jgi:hypothetical protein
MSGYPHPSGDGRVEGSRFSKGKSRHGFFKKIKNQKSIGFSVGKSALGFMCIQKTKYGMEAAAVFVIGINSCRNLPKECIV